MCEKFQILSKNKLGEIYFCNSCKMYHVLFNNIHLTLTNNQINSLKEYIDCVDVGYWEAQFECTAIKRKIPIPTFQDNLILIFDKMEFDALKCLFASKMNSERILSAGEIDYQYILN